MTEPVVITLAVAGLSGVRFPRGIMVAAQAVYTVGLVFAYWLFHQAMFDIGALCPWCLLVTGATTLVWWELTRLNILHDNLGLPRPAQAVLAGAIRRAGRRRGGPVGAAARPGGRPAVRRRALRLADRASRASGAHSAHVPSAVPPVTRDAGQVSSGPCAVTAKARSASPWTCRPGRPSPRPRTDVTTTADRIALTVGVTAAAGAQWFLARALASAVERATVAEHRELAAARRRVTAVVPAQRTPRTQSPVTGAASTVVAAAAR